MSTFDSTKTSLKELLDDICTGRLQLPDFQRGWVWDDDRIRDLLVSIARAFPIGAVMLLETGGNVRFQLRPVEGIDPATLTSEAESLILDGQQRLTSLAQALWLTAPVDTTDGKGKHVKRHYYFHIPTAIEGPDRIEEALIAVDEHRQIRSDFDRKIDLDLSTRRLECEQLYFPCDQIINSDRWEEALQEHNPEAFPLYMQFRREVSNSFRNYQIPVIKLRRETSKEAVCLVFEKVNTGGVQLSVFELVTAGYAAENFNLRDDWYGSEIRNRESREARLAQDPLLEGLDATAFLQSVSLLHTYEQRVEDNAAGKVGKQARAVSAKRATVLDLPLTAYKKWADKLEAGFKQAAYFLRKECFYAARELPYRTQVAPLAVVLTLLGDRWREPQIHKKLVKWYWCGVLGELYGSAVEARMANDVEKLMSWFEDDNDQPRTVIDASFHADRLDSLRSRISAAYKAINVLVLRRGARDFFWNDTIQQLDHEDISLDIHHIFPQRWCREQAIPPKVYDSIINKTPISARTNRMIGGNAPSLYIDRIQRNARAKFSDAEMNEILESHSISPSAIRRDDFETFMRERRDALLGLIEDAMGKAVARPAERDEPTRTGVPLP